MLQSLALVALIMYTVSGITHRWFYSLYRSITLELQPPSLSAISVIGVDKFFKVPVFGYVAKRFQVPTLIPLLI